MGTIDTSKTYTVSGEYLQDICDATKDLTGLSSIEVSSVAEAIRTWRTIVFPVTVWEVPEGTAGLFALQSNITDNPSWQLTGLDMTQFKRIKIYTKCGQKSGSTPSASTTPGGVLEMHLDSRAGGPYSGHFVGSMMGQNPNDSNRLWAVTCAVSADKTSFACLRMTTLYGTAATNNNDANAYIYKIEGYYI